ncbi:uncharacterized protein LOC114657546 [Erpetoichthys calabaricus]|uniref:uncharacterized protein LOC114657546 n=1 Tax=Erpetoichthys calabaricus TaxID=27687 RepID=UPI00109FCAEB|nr:uncharacterized protein LOC114657546 [Erpetoichthys calabaricus]
MLVQVKHNQQQKYVKLDEDEGQFDFLQFHEKVIEKFCLPPDAKVIYRDATGTEIDAEIFSELVGQGNVVVTVFCDDEFSTCSLSSVSEMSDSSLNSNASTVIVDEVPSKRRRIEDGALSSKQLIEDVLRAKSGGEKVLQEYQTSETLTDSTRRQMIHILVTHMIDNHGNVPTKAIREEYALGIVTLFPSLKDPYTKRGYVDQDFTLLFDDDTSSRLFQKWDLFFKPNVIKEAKCLTSTPELRRLMQSAESLPGRPKAPKISACDAVERLVVFHKSCCSLEEHVRSQHGRQPYLLTVGRQKSKTDSFYISMDKHLVPCQANRSLAAFDELFKAHFVFNSSYDAALVNFYTFLQTTVYNIDVGKMKESPRVRELRARLLNQPVQFSL